MPSRPLPPPPAHRLSGPLRAPSLPPVLRRLGLPLLAIALGVGAQPADAGVAQLPAPCDSYVSLGEGTLELELCPVGSFVTGTLRWEGRSGQSQSVLGGVVADRSIHLVERFPVKNAPAEGWRFCFDALYDLSRSDDGQILAGRYWSEDCQDRGTLTLARRLPPPP